MPYAYASVLPVRSIPTRWITGRPDADRLAADDSEAPSRRRYRSLQLPA